MIEISYKRCYLGIPIPEAFIDVYKEVQNELRRSFQKLAFEKSEKAHITLYYLGDNITEILDEINKSIGQTMAKYLGNTITINGIDYFENTKTKTLYFRVEDSKWIQELNSELSQRLSVYNFQEKIFKPHMTITRFRDPISKNEFLEQKSEILSKFSNYRFTSTISKFEMRGTNRATQKLEVFYQYV